MLADIFRGIVAAILNFMKGVVREPTTTVDIDDQPELRDALFDRIDELRRAEGGDGSTDEGGDEGGA
jgi:hypothetical protein